ncbi:hypothetical protein KAW55_01800 [bacterium]|nr:hypothetical protein [bacterium]
MEAVIGYGSDVNLIKVENVPQEDFVEIPSFCFDITVVLPAEEEPQETEMTDQEFRILAAQSKTYDFWDNAADDIYSVSDGTPL